MEQQNGHKPVNGKHTNGTSNGVHKNGNGNHVNGNQTNGAMPTTIYEAVDTVRNGAFNGKNGLKPHPIPDPIPEPAPTPLEMPEYKRTLALQLRFFRVLIFAAWLFARTVFWQIYVRRYLPGWVDSTNVSRWAKYARQYRGFAIDLGGVHIKLGQFISTRVDALPESITRELASLQDEVPTIPFKDIRPVLENEIGRVAARYEWFQEEPIAAASLGQVYRAKLKGGERVVVKVQRPGIREICYTDLAALRIVARIAARFGFISRRADPAALAEEFGKVLLEELSYEHEARNAERFAAMFKDDPGVYIPQVYKEHSTDRVLTLEDVTSIKINDFAGLERAGISRKLVAQRLMNTYLKQVFEFSFFHADPHPGNLFVYPLPLEEGEPIPNGKRPFYLIFVDFGMTGSLTRQIAEGMVNTMAAVINRDPHRLVQSYHQLGLLLPNADLRRIEEAVKAAFDEVWGLSMSEIRDLDYDRVMNVATEFNDLIKSMPFYIPQDFIYLGRTLSILSGMATSLDPMFNPWQELEPYTRRLIAKGFGVNVGLNPNDGANVGVAILQNLFNGNSAQAFATIGQEITRRTGAPALAIQVLEEIRDGEVQVIAEPSPALKAQLRRLETQNGTSNRAILFGSILIASTVLHTGGETSLAAIGYAYCLLSAVYGFLKG